MSEQKMKKPIEDMTTEEFIDFIVSLIIQKAKMEKSFSEQAFEASIMLLTIDEKVTEEIAKKKV